MSLFNIPNQDPNFHSRISACFHQDEDGHRCKVSFPLNSQKSDHFILPTTTAAFRSISRSNLLDDVYNHPTCQCILACPVHMEIKQMCA
jgi:hypothetical protein